MLTLSIAPQLLHRRGTCENDCPFAHIAQLSESRGRLPAVAQGLACAALAYRCQHYGQVPGRQSHRRPLQ